MFYETSLFGGVRPGALLFSEGKGTMFKPPGVRLWVGLLEVNAHLRVRQESLSKNAEDSWGGGLPGSEQSSAWGEACSCVYVSVCLLTLLVP